MALKSSEKEAAQKAREVKEQADKDEKTRKEEQEQKDAAAAAAASVEKAKRDAEAVANTAPEKMKLRSKVEETQKALKNLSVLGEREGAWLKECGFDGNPTPRTNGPVFMCRRTERILSCATHISQYQKNSTLPSGVTEYVREFSTYVDKIIQFINNSLSSNPLILRKPELNLPSSLKLTTKDVMEALFPRAELPLIDLHITVERDQPGSKKNPRFYRTFQFFGKGNLNNPKDQEEAQEKMRTELDRNMGLFKTAIEKKLGELKDVRKKSIEDWVPQLTFWVNSLPS